MSVDIAGNSLAYVEVATVDSDIAATNAAEKPGAEQTDWHSSDFAKRKKVAKPAGKRKTEGGREKIAPIQKTWVIKVQYPPPPMLSFFYNS